MRRKCLDAETLLTCTVILKLYVTCHINTQMYYSRAERKDIHSTLNSVIRRRMSEFKGEVGRTEEKETRLTLFFPKRRHNMSNVKETSYTSAKN